MDLKGSKAVITGASSGIGEAIALELAACLTLTARWGDGSA
jgi:NAD(P)-dependent dehydrogenase (short-subunit alcohol dehydrogenase family)